MFSHGLPLTEPVPVFSVLLLVLLLFPLLFKKLKIPGLVGLIIGGMIIGPNGFNLIARDSSMILLGTIGMLYIMFIAGLELDINQLKANSSHSIVFGALTFIVPLTLGLITSIYILDYAFLPSFIIALMMSTHTLVAYPIASRLGLTQTRSITTVVGGTIITDTAVLFIFGATVHYSQGNLTMFFWLQFIASLALFAFVVLWGFPKLARWFFKNIEEDNYSQFIFVFALILLAGEFAELAGVEPIIGAFFAGLTLNRLIPHNSALMSRIQFTGNAIFIPLFLLSVGMIVDLRVLMSGGTALFVAVVLSLMALFSKWIAATITRFVFGYSTVESNLIFALSSSRAAASIAIILIGFNFGLIDSQILNGTILLILITSLVSSFITESEGRKLAIIEQSKKPAASARPLRILVPCSNPATIDKLLDFAVACKVPGQDEPIFPLTVMTDHDDLTENILANNLYIEKFAKLSYPNETKISPTSRLDTNVANGIIRAVKEMMISVLILGWTEKSKTSGFFFGKKSDNVLEATSQTVLLTRLNHLINITKRIFVYVPENSEFEIGFLPWLKLLSQISKNAGAAVSFYGNAKTLGLISNYAKLNKTFLDSNFKPIDNIDTMYEIVSQVPNDDIFVLVNSRTKSISYSVEVDSFMNRIANDFDNLNFIIIYPETSSIGSIEEIAHLDVLEPSLILENINLLQRAKKLISRIVSRN